MQVDPDLDYCLAGDSNFHAPLENDSLVTWTDGRQVVQGRNEMDVYFDRVPLCAPITVAPTILPNGIVGQAYSETVTATGGTSSSSWPS